jgi:WhiB family redox-sensing transcriptional regulator
MDLFAELLNSMQAPWKADAACREHLELSWFPDRGADQSRQKAICARCLVQRECLIAGAEEFGVWGGASERARRRAKGELDAA